LHLKSYIAVFMCQQFPSFFKKNSQWSITSIVLILVLLQYAVGKDKEIQLVRLSLSGIFVKRKEQTES
jgi:hypothetical protein